MYTQPITLPQSYHYRFITVMLALGFVWVFITLFSILVNAILYFIDGTFLTFHLFEFIVILLITLYLTFKLYKQPVFTLTDTGIRQGNAYIPYADVKNVVQFDRYGLKAMYFFDEKEDKPRISLFFPRSIKQIYEAIPFINERITPQISL